MNTFYLVRHGETENNRARRLSGWIDTPLTDNGLEPTTKVVAKLQGMPIDEMYSSDLGRAFVTAYVVARGLGFSKEIMRLPSLREVNYGVAANLPSTEAYKLYPRLDRDTHYVPPEGESLATMQARVLQAVNDVNDTHTSKTILLVAHSGVMAALRASLLGVDFGAHNISEAYAHDYVARFTIKNGKIASFEEVL
ncbi:MAG TPA: histidine phosphatase family protein [Candidatus Saccharimonadales bacterium]|jgi:probable phosphoglycerate mutase